MSPWRQLTLALLAMAAVPLTILLIALGPYTYNTHLTSLGRFAKLVSIGDSEASVVINMIEFQKEYAGTTTFVESTSDVDLYGEKEMGSGGRVVTLYQSSIFDDIRLRVLFRDGVVAQKQFVGD